MRTSPGVGAQLLRNCGIQPGLPKQMPPSSSVARTTKLGANAPPRFANPAPGKYLPRGGSYAPVANEVTPRWSNAAAVILDFETNGMQSGNIPTQLAYAVVDHSGTTLEEHSCFLRGATVLDDWVLENCPHITLEKCAAGDEFDDALLHMFAAVPFTAVVVCHNARFDLGRIAALGNRHVRNHLLARPQLCTMETSKDLCKLPLASKYDAQRARAKRPRVARYKFPKLQELAAHFSIDDSDTVAHDAIGDVELTRRCLVALCQSGVTTVLKQTPPRSTPAAEPAPRGGH